MVGVGVAVLSAFFNAFVILVLTLYFMASLPRVTAAAYRLSPASKRDKVTQIGDRIVRNIGAYVSGAFVVALCAGVSLVDLPVRRRARRVRRRSRRSSSRCST